MNTILFANFIILVYKYIINGFKNISIALFIMSSLTSLYFLQWQKLLISLLYYLYIALLLLIAS